jgi:serine/threonine protein phosphatase PrpC
VANVGDSRAILGRRSRLVCDGIEVVAMSRDHKPSLPEERARIEAAGATVVPVGEGLGYEVGVAGTELRLRMSRSFGDFYLKQTEGLAPYEQPICAVPELELLPRSPEDAFVVIACDGVWDVMTNQEVADSVASSLRAGGSRSPAEACDNLLRACLERGSTDNMTALVILLESSAKDTLASQEADTPLVHLMSSVSIGSAMRSVGSPSVEEENAEDSESDSCKKNLTLEFE